MYCKKEELKEAAEQEKVGGFVKRFGETLFSESMK